MVTIVDVKPLNNEEGEEYFGLVVQGGLEAVKSKESGRVYFTARTTTVPTTFNAATCKGMIGSKIPGRVVRIDVEPYDYNLPDSDEVIELNYRYVYMTEEDNVIAENMIEEEEVF